MSQELSINFVNDLVTVFEFGRTAKDERAFPAQLELRESGLEHRVTSQGTIKEKKKPPLFQQIAYKSLCFHLIWSSISLLENGTF